MMTKTVEQQIFQVIQLLYHNSHYYQLIEEILILLIFGKYNNAITINNFLKTKSFCQHSLNLIYLTLSFQSLIALQYQQIGKINIEKPALIFAEKNESQEKDYKLFQLIVKIFILYWLVVQSWAMILYSYNINQSQMLNNFKTLIILSVIILACLAIERQCKLGEIKISKNCIDCKILPNTIRDINFIGRKNQCPCSQQYEWSEKNLQCLPIRNNKTSTISQKTFDSQNIETQPSRLLQATCDTTKGFIVLNSVCVNCKVLPFTYGVNIDTSNCACYPSYKSSSGKCSCPYGRYIDGVSKQCIPCITYAYSIGSTTSSSACTGCNLLPFTRSSLGCINCLTLANNGGTTACCATGYKFDGTLISCICDKSKGYSIGSNGVCSACASGDTNCKNCVNNYVYNGFFCVYGQLIPNYNMTSYKCNTGYAFKKDSYSGQIISCACTTQYYQSGSTCNSCSSPPKGVTTSNCQSCSLSAGFYAGTVDCIYCPAIVYAVGTATASGCDCQANYFWNPNTARCQCDYNIGLIGGVISPCLNCRNIPYTDSIMLVNACSCVSGYKWDTNTNACICDLSSPSVFVSNGVCYDCAIIDGSFGTVASDKISCVCIGSFFWNYGLNKCQCDSAQNFAVFNGECSDCSLNSLSIGLAYNQQCLCLNNYIINSLGTCGCPSGYVLVGKICTACSSITLPTGTSVSDCNTCNAAKGFANKNGICALCSSQSLVSSSTVTNGLCTCPSKMVWRDSIGGCACDWSTGYVTSIDSTGKYTCNLGRYTWSDGSYACGWSFLIYSSYTNICTDASTDPKGSVSSSGVFSCNSGYIWSEASFPFRCVQGGAVGQYYTKGNSGLTPTFSLCTSLSGSTLQTACKICDYNQGFLLISNQKMCVYCPSVTGASSGAGSATLNSCVCTSGYWNPITVNCDTSVTCTSGLIYNPFTKKCDICDAIYSVTVGGQCISCKADKNSVGYAATSTSCVCKPSYIWSNSGSCTSSSSTCSSSTSILINGVCFKCPTTNGGTGVPDGTTGCGCKSGYLWNPTSTGGSCNCNPATSTVLSTGVCFICPNNANTTGSADSSGKCACNSNYIWDGIKALSCICDATINGYVTSSGLCFRCLSTLDSQFDGTIVNGGCNCKNSFLFVATETGGSCKCTSPSVLLPTGACLTCLANENTTGTANSSQCLCYNNFIWSSSANNCICDSTVFAYVTGSGYCFQCLPSVDVNFDKTIVNEGCNCKNSFTFTATNVGGSCKCSPPHSVYNGICSQCPINVNTTGDTLDEGGCQCVKLDYIWSSEFNTCACDYRTQSYITQAGTCYTCTPDMDPRLNGSVIPGGCLCTLQFTWVAVNDGGGCQCLPKTTSFVLSSTGQCFTCPKDTVTTGTPDGSGGCTCKTGLVWDKTKLTCICGGSSVALPNGTCFICGTKNTYTNSTISGTNACQCASSILTWNNKGYCDCGSTAAMIIQGNSFTCVTCDSKIRAKSKFNSTSCTCTNTKILIWNNITSQCDCGLTSVVVGSKCIPCSASINANGLNTTNPTTCKCLITAMSWSTKSNSCVCNSTQVRFIAPDGSISCVSCNVKINAKSKSTQTVCNCHTGFQWIANKGCTCINPNGIVNIIKDIPKCIVCSLQVYSSGLTTSGIGCICLGSLVWSNTTLSCGCNSSSAISYNGAYFCAACNTKTFSKTPVVSLTNCTCTATKLVWYNEGYCACPDRSTSVVIGSGASTTCIVCDQKIYSNGKTSPSSNICDCMDPILKYNNGICDCGSGQALTILGVDIFKCVGCNNPAIFTKAKISPKQCSCVSTALAWDPVNGVCSCSDLTKIVVGSGATASCSGCVGQYTTVRTTITNCSCAGTGLVFVPSKTTAGSCACPKNQILNPMFICVACPNSNTPTTPYECTCAKDYFWNTISLTCQKCSTILNANATGGNIFACTCKTGFIWDVMTLTCIVPCTAGDQTCMNCNVPYTTGEAAISTTTTQPGLTGSSAIYKLIAIKSTNYLSINKFQCPCIPGFKWDGIRYRCFNQSLI